MVLRSINNFAELNNVNLICFEGGALNSPFEYEKHNNAVFDLISKKRLDGLIILSACIARYASYQQMKEFCQKFDPLPIVSISYEIDNVSSVLVNNKLGLKELINHLIKEHKYKNFSFVKGTKGNHDAIERYQVFIDTLLENNILLNEDLVFSGDFTINGGIEAAKKIIKFKDIIDVIVAANDPMAFGIIEELERNKIRIPHDIAVTGFDNVRLAKYSSPPLTSVSLPIYKQGEAAVKMIIDIINQKETPKKILIPTQSIIRESCGCFSLKSTKSNAKTKNKASFNDIFLKHKDIIYNNVINNIIDLSHNSILADLDGVINKALKEFKNSIINNNNNFLDYIFHIISLPQLKGGDVYCFYILISEIRYNIIPYLSDKNEISKIEDLCHNTFKIIGQKSMQIENKKHETLILNNQKLNDLRYRLLLISDIDEQMKILKNSLDELNIKTIYMTSYNTIESKEKKLKLFFALKKNEKQNINPDEGKICSLKKIIPDKYFPKNTRFSLLIKSLKDYGFIIFDLQSNHNMKFLSTLTDILGSTMKTSSLFNKVQNQKNNLNRNLAKLRQAMGGFIETMAMTIEIRDPYTAGHQRRVSDLARAIATEMKLDEMQIESIRMAGLVHDLGKMFVPAEILNKPGKITDIEFNLIRTHPEVSYEILKNIDFPWPIADIVYQHHERLNGSGYPEGLLKDEIKLEAMIIAVADVVEAMASHRPYRPSLGIDAALEEINKNKCIYYLEEAVDVCIRLFKEKGYHFK